MNLDFTFLTEEQIFSDNRLEIFKKRGTNAPISDFAILCGGYVSNNYHYNNNNKSLKKRSGWYWTKTPYSNNVRTVGPYGNIFCSNVFKRIGGNRPALPFSSIQKISTNIVSGNDGIKEVEFGEYPQMVAPADVQVLLECALDKRQTGKTYTMDSRKYNDYDKQFDPKTLYEYEYKGKKYVKVQANSFDLVSEFTLSNGKKYKYGDYVWVEVSPIKWLVDEKYDIAVSERLLFAGIQFDEKDYDGDFENTRIKRFMDECFSKEIIVNSIKINYEQTIDEKKDYTYELNKQNLTIDNIFDEALFKMNEIIDKENEKGFMKVKK